MNGIFILSKETQKSVFKQVAFPVGNKTWYSVLDGFSSSISEGKALKKSRRGEETRKGKTRWRKVGCKERQRGQTLGVWAALLGPRSLLFSLAFCLDHMLPGPLLSEKKKGQINQVMKNENQDPQKENSCLLHEIAFKQHTLPAQERKGKLLPLPSGSLTNFICFLFGILSAIRPGRNWY